MVSLATLEETAGRYYSEVQLRTLFALQATRQAYFPLFTLSRSSFEVRLAELHQRLVVLYPCQTE